MVVNLDDWSVIRPEAAGRDERKFWVSPTPDAPRSEHWLWKPRRLTDDGTIPAINDVAEVVASRLAIRLNIPAAVCRFAVLAGESGVISRNVTPSGHDLHGGDVFLDGVPGYVRRPTQLDAEGREVGRLRRDEGYTLEAVATVLTGVSGPPGWERLSAFNVFSGFLVLDAFIANTDRHPRNWAMLERRSDGQRFLAPTFDHGSALGSGMTDIQRTARSVEAFCRKGKANPFTPRGQLLRDLALQAAQMAGASPWIDALAAFADAEIQATLDAPTDRLSEEAATFVGKVLIVNRRRLCHVDGD